MHDLARRGKPNRAGIALQQRGPDRAFKIGELLTDGRGACPKAARRGGNRAFIGRGHEHLDPPKGYPTGAFNHPWLLAKLRQLFL